MDPGGHGSPSSSRKSLSPDTVAIYERAYKPFQNLVGSPMLALMRDSKRFKQCLRSKGIKPRPSRPTNGARGNVLVRLLALLCWLGAQPQRDVGGLHRLPDHPYEVVAQGVQVRLVSELGRESL